VSSEPIDSGSVTTADELVAIAVDATANRIRAQAFLDAELERRATVAWHLFHDRRLRNPQIAAAIREGLRTRGFSDEELDGAGIRRDNIRRMTETAEPPGPILHAPAINLQLG